MPINNKDFYEKIKNDTNDSITLYDMYIDREHIYKVDYINKKGNLKTKFFNKERFEYLKERAEYEQHDDFSNGDYIDFYCLL